MERTRVAAPPSTNARAVSAGDRMAESVLSPSQIAEANRLLANKPPQDVLRWAVKTFHPRLTMATAFGAEGCCLLHMLAEIEPAVRVFNLETGYQFRETY